MEWKPDDIKGLRKKLSLSQRQFAERLGVKRLTIARWESGKMKPNPERLAMLEKLANDTKNVSSNDTTQDDTNDTKNDTNVSSEQENVSWHDTNDTKSENVSREDTKQDTKNVTNENVTDGNVTDENVTDQNGLGRGAILIGLPPQTYYETMYKDAKGVISLCTITQPKDSDKESSLRVRGFYEISGKFDTATPAEQIPDLIAEANKLNGRSHIYTGIHPLRERPDKGRGKEKDILGVAFFAADVDAKDFIDDPTERQKAIKEKAFYQWTDELLVECKAKALAQIHEVCDKVSVPPSAIIDSGHGFYPIFKFDKFIEFSSDQHREELKQVNKAFHEAFAADSTFDFARILRVPGTRNIKPGYPADCELVELHPDRRYTLDDILRFETLTIAVPSSSRAIAREDEAFRKETPPKSEPEPEAQEEAEDTTQEEATESSVLIDLDREDMSSRFDLAEETVRWITTGKWAEGKKDTNGKPWTRSHRDHSVVCRLVAAGATDDEIKAIFKEYPVGDKYREPNNGDRYLFLSIAKAREYQEKVAAEGVGNASHAKEKGEKEKSPTIPIHLTDIEKSEYEGQEVQTDVLLPGVGRDDSFFVPKRVEATCEKEDKSKCGGCPLVSEGIFTYEFYSYDRRLIRFTKQTDEQVSAEIRKALSLPAKCKEYKYKVKETTEIQIILAVPKAGAELRKEGGKFVDEHGRDFREKVIYYSGVVPRSNTYYSVQGTVISDPKSQRATMLANNLCQLQNEYERFTITEDTKALLSAFQTDDDSAVGINNKMRELGRDIAYNIAGYFGEPRVNIVIADMLTWHSVLQFPFDGDILTKGWIDLLIFGDSGINKTTHLRKLRNAISFGHFVDGGAVSRAGLLYSLDDVHSGIRILRWGALPLNDGQLVIIDESQNIVLDVWQEMSSARTTGLLTVTKAKQGEHPMRTRQIYTANPKPPNTMASFSFPIRGIKDLMRPADMRRFDIVVCASRGEVEVDEVNQLQAERGEIVPPRIKKEHLKASIARAWTRRPEHVIWSDGAEAAVMDIATKLQQQFGCGDIPVIDIDAKDKVARGAVAVATMLVSTDETFEPVIVKPGHAHWIGMYLMGLYSAQAAMLDKHAQVAGKMERIANIELDIILQEWQKLNPPEPEHLAEMAILIAEGEGIERDVLAAQVGVTPRQISTLIQKFKQHRFVKSTRKGYYATPRLVAFYRAKYDELSNLALH